MKIKSFISSRAVLSDCKDAVILLVLLMVTASSFAQEPPLVPRSVFDAAADRIQGAREK